MTFVKTPEEKALVISIHSGTLIMNLEDITPLLLVVAKWRFYLTGMPKDGGSSEELAGNTEFIKENYPHLTVSEIELAFNLSVTNKLEEVKFFGGFSPLYIGKVLSAYTHYRRVTLTEPMRKMERLNEEKMERNKKPTPEEEAQLTKHIIHDFYKQAKETGEITDPFNLAYNFLRNKNHKFMTVTQADIDEALKYGESKYVAVLASEDLFSKVHHNKESEVKRHSRNFLVKKYFDTVDIQWLLDSIKPELFTKFTE